MRQGLLSREGEGRIRNVTDRASFTPRKEATASRLFEGCFFFFYQSLFQIENFPKS